MFEYRQLEALGAVIEYGGFDRAAEVLGLTQSAVTHRVKGLETYVGKPLVVRSNPPVPTEAGIPFYSHFKKMRLLEDDLKEVTGETGSRAPLALGVNASTLTSWFNPVLRKIMGAAMVDLHIGESLVVHDLLQQGTLAGCISIRSKASRGCSVEHLGDLVLRCTASREFRKRHFPGGLTLDAMLKAPAVLFHPESQMLRMFQKNVLGLAPFDVPCHFIPSQTECLNVISEGLAYGFLPEMVFHKHQADRGLIDLSPMGPTIIPQYWHRWGIESELLEDVTGLLRLGAREHLIR
ncbi:MAG: ArgP/LysG family DNA-binding transcriptional regulator [Spirochaetales bacterium]|nr:ArgP/LysG family DNA-binding transcriptional regulator [Spirochaetales bacterium]